MATVPVTRTWVAGEVVTAAHFNTNIRDVLQYLLAPPTFRGRQTSAQTLTTSTLTAILLDTEDVDSAGGHSTVTNTSRYTAVYPGWYSYGGSVAFATDNVGNRLTEAAKNGTAVNGSRRSQAAISANATCVDIHPDVQFLNVGDYLEPFGFHSKGSNLNTAVAAQEQSSFIVKWESN